MKFKLVALLLVYSFQLPDIQVLSGKTKNLWNLDYADTLIDGAYAQQYNGEGVNVYVLDSGILLNNPEFEKRAKLIYTSEDILQKDRKTNDCSGHGTHVSGIIAGKNVGIAKKVNLFALRVFGCESKILDDRIVKALDFLDKKIKTPAIINLSLGPNYETDTFWSSTAVSNKLNEITTKHGITAVIAAGNDNVTMCSGFVSGSHNKFLIGSISAKVDVSSFSNRGTCVDFYAPGEKIESSDLNEYGTRSGTSQAAPYITGILALHINRSGNKKFNYDYLSSQLKTWAVKQATLTIPIAPLSDEIITLARRKGAERDEERKNFLYFVIALAGCVVLALCLCIIIIMVTRKRSKLKKGKFVETQKINKSFA